MLCQTAPGPCAVRGTEQPGGGQHLPISRDRNGQRPPGPLTWSDNATDHSADCSPRRQTEGLDASGTRSASNSANDRPLMSGSSATGRRTALR